jgi:thiamine pyrophosphokinase
MMQYAAVVLSSLIPLPLPGKEVALVANGAHEDLKYLKTTLASYSDVVAVDGGLNILAEIGVTPTLIVGDLDSATAENLALFSNTEIRQYPCDKDETDLELAIALAFEGGATTVVVYGAFGKRVDHMQGNLILLSRYRGRLSFESAQESVIVIDHTLRLNTFLGQTISLIPVNGPAKGIVTQGLKWELNGGVLDREFIGISNVAQSTEVEISVSSGDLMCIVNKTEL